MDNDIDGKIEELRGRISTLEWDMPKIKNNALRAHKERELIRYKKELDEFMKMKIKQMA